MILEQLQIQEDIKSDLNTQMEIDRTQMTDKFQAEMTTEIGKIR